MTRIYLPILTLLLCLAACTDDLTRTDTPQPGPGEGLISLSLPGIVYDNADATSTRVPTDGDEVDATQDERRVTSLWFMAYPTTDGDGEALVQLLRPSDDELTHDYKTFNIRIKAGTYHIYVVANMPEIAPTYTEQQLKDCILSYRNGTGENATLVLPSPKSTDGLPMVYESTDAVNITAAQTEPITADLVFTCVKVRCTLWFDNTDGGHSNAVFGQNYLLMQNITGRNIATKAPLLPTEQAIEGMELLSTAEGALNGLYADGEYSEDAHENLTFNSNSPQDNGQWAYRTTFYLPEHYVTKNDGQSYLDITAALHDATDTKKANLQYTLPLGDEPTDSQPLRQLPRGKYYDIVGKIVNLGGEIESTVSIEDWTPKEVNTELESPYHLWVKETVIKELKSGTPVTIPCRTDAPRLEAFSTDIKIESGGVTILPTTQTYLVTFNEDYTAFTVQINPAIPPSTSLEEERFRYILIRIPDPENEGKYLLSKRIDIEKVSTDPYFHVTPKEYTVRISDIGNLPEHTVIFSYETNLTEVNVKCGDETITTTGIKWSENTNVTITNSGLENGKGTVSVTLNKPYEPANYTRTQTVTLDYTATYDPSGEVQPTITREDHTTVTIIPNAQTYRLHFRPVDDSWTNPHIYVYEPLYAPDGTEVLITGGRGLIYNGQIKDFWGTPNADVNNPKNDLLGENALQYSFTGKRTFLGWQGEGGTIETPKTYYYNGNEHYWDGDYYFSLKYLQFDNWSNGNGAQSAYNWDIDYVAQEFRNECSECNMSAPKGHNNVDTENPSDGYNYKWPGVAMKEDPENPGWFYFDLPALAKPGKALIMFADGHDGPKGTVEECKPKRYPAHMVPGVPLYDYADKDGWFLYDYQKGDDNGFVDDKPEIEVTTYRINIPRNSYPRIHVWIVDGATITNWDDASTGVIQTDEKGRYFQFSIKGSPLSGAIRYKYIDSGNKEYDGEISVNNWKQVTGETYDYEYTIN